MSRGIRTVLLCLMAVLVGTGARGAEAERAPETRMVPQIGHSQWLHEILFTLDGRRIVTSSNDDRVKVWTRDGRLIRTLRVGSNRSIDVNPDGTLLAVGTMRGRAELWTLAGEYLGAFPSMGSAIIGGVAFTPDGKALFVCTTMTKADHCREFPLDGAPGIRIDDPFGTSNVKSIDFSPDGSIVYLAGGQEVHPFRRDGTPLTPLRVTEGFLETMAVSPDGALIACGDSRTPRDGALPHTRLWTTEGELVAEFPGHASRSLEFSADGEWLFAGGEVNNRLLQVHRTGAPDRSFVVGTSREDTPATIGVAPDGSMVVTSGMAIDPVTIERWSPDGEPLGRFNTVNNNVMAMDFDSRLGLIVTTSVDDVIRYWSVDGRLLRSHASGDHRPNLLAIAPNGNALVSGSTELTVWDGEGRSLVKFPVHKRGSRALRFSTDGAYLMTGGIDGYVTLTAAREGATSRRFVAHDGKDVTALAVHPDGRRFATGSVWERFRIWDLDGTRLADFKLPEGTKPPFSTIEAIEFTPDGKELVVASLRRGEEIRIYDMHGTLRRSAGFPVRSTFQNGRMTVSPDGRWIAATVNRDICLWDLATLELKKTFEGHGGWIDDLEFSADGLHLVSADGEGVIRVWNVSTGASYAMFSAGDEWVLYTDDGYFDASRAGGDLVAMVSGDQLYGIDQFAAAYNRPDVIHERVGLVSVDTIEHFRAFHRRRVSNLAASAAGTGTAPVVRITETRREGEQVTLTLDTETAASAEVFLQVHANGVPLYREPGLRIDGGRRTSSVRVDLAGGRNKIEVGLETADGVRSLRVPLLVERPDKTGDLYFVGLGVSRYAVDSLNLEYAAKDVADLGRVLEGFRGSFREVHRLELTDDAVTRDGLAEVGTFLAAAGVNDTVVMLVSGHGAYELTDLPTYFFVPHDADPERLAETGIPFDELEARLTGIAPRRRLLLLDTCQSGEYDATTLRAAAAQASDRGLTLRARERLLAEESTQRPPYVYRRDRYIYNDVSRRSGAVVFSSSLARESSLESSRLENGVFTYALIEAFKDRSTDTNGDGSVSIAELETAVKSWVATATGDLQHPTIERENIDQAIRFPVVADRSSSGG